jgi:phospholipid/cholesterol/gamma-HCH transport system substrate-binding protein
LGQYRYSQRGYLISVSFNDVSGLNRDDPVQMLGVKIGKVEKLNLKSNQVIVNLRIDEEYLLPKDSKIVIESIGMLGEKAIKIEPGNSPLFLSPGDTAQGQVAFGLDNLGDMVLELKSRTDKLFSDENLNNLSSILSDLTKTIKQIEQISNHHGEDIGAIIQNVRKSSETIADNRKNINDVISNMKASTTKLDSAARQINLIAANINEITQKITQGKGSMGKLVYSDSLYQKLLNAAGKIDSLADDIKKNPQRYLKIRVF